MTTAHNRLKARYANAGARLDTAENEVRGVSRARLAELMKLPERQRFGHIEDPTLTPQDRSSLRRSVAAKLPASRFQPLRRNPIIPVASRVRRHLPALIITSISIAPVVTWTALTWQNTGEMYVVDRPLHVNWRYPSGEIQPLVIADGKHVVLVHSRITGSYFRYWIAGQGYATAKVNYVEKEQ